MRPESSDERLSELLHLLSPPTGARLWFGGASPMGCLRGVSVETASWKPYEGGRSIWEQVLHMAYWIYVVRRGLDGTPKGSFPRAPSNWPVLPEHRDASLWRSDRALLKSEHDIFVEIVGRLPPHLLDEAAPGKGSYRTIDLLFGVVQHNTHHTAQIQLLKRLHRAGRS
jgi:uncharacterized damage-inducible protein DinB